MQRRRNGYEGGGKAKGERREGCTVLSTLKPNNEVWKQYSGPQNITLLENVGFVLVT